MPLSIQDFIARWKGSAGSEEANSQSFWKEFCEALELPTVDPKGLDDAYCFEKKIQHEAALPIQVRRPNAGAAFGMRQLDLFLKAVGECSSGKGALDHVMVVVSWITRQLPDR